MNILVITSVYDDESFGQRSKATPIVNLFAREWVKQGHHVVAVHNAHRYPVLVHKLPTSVKAKLAAKLGFGIADYDMVQEKHFNDYGVDVWKLPIAKNRPHKTPSKKSIDKQAGRIKDILQAIRFVPDVVVGHWASPQMEIMAALKQYYPCRNAIVLHGTGYVDQKDFPAKEYLKHIDKIGCRSKTQAERVKEILALDAMPFVCYSGVPDAYLQKFSLNTGKFHKITKWRFAYVGRLVGYKRVDLVIKSLARFPFVDWELSIIGEGAERESLEKLCDELNCSDRVKFLGRIPRDDVMEVLKDTHCFIMVSKGEIFGLVYLEAMAASCVTIGSIGEGIDGILVDGENGFLCKPADEQALVDALQSLFDMNEDAVCRIAANGYNTANAFSDSQAAKRYLEIVTE